MYAGMRCSFGVIVLVLAAHGLVQPAAQGHPGCSSGGCSSSSSRPSASEEPTKPRLMGQEPLSSRAPHRGKVTKGSYQSFEVVYLPHETRVYIYGPTDRPAKAQGVQGRITMQVKGNPTVYEYPLQYMAPIPDSNEGDCLHAQVDVTRIRDGDMQVTVELGNLPYSMAEPTAQFQQIFALSRVPQTGAGASFSQAASHQSGIGTIAWNYDVEARAQASDAPCCADCKKEAGMGLQVIPPPGRGQQVAVSPPAIRAQQVTADDRAAVESQRFCPVMRQTLGSRGIPWKVFVDGQPIFICCPECAGQVESQSAAYLAEARRLRGW